MHGIWSRRLLLAGGLMSLAACGPKAPAGPVDGNKAMGYVEKLVSFSPRPMGSEQLARAGDWIEQELKALGLKPQRDEFDVEKEHVHLRNIFAQVDGEDPAGGPILLLGAHYDTKLAAGHPDPAHNFPFLGAIDGSGGPAVLLELGRVLTKEPKYKPKVNVWLLFIDGEESLDWDWNLDRALLGSKHFAAKLTADKQLRPRIKAFVLLDLIGSKDYKIDRDPNSSNRLQDIFVAAAKAMGSTDRVYEFTSRGTTDDHEPFVKVGIPSVDLIDFEFRIPFHLRGTDKQPFNPDAPRHPRDDDFKKWWHSAEDKPGNMSPDALAFAGDLVMAAWPDLEAFCRK